MCHQCSSSPLREYFKMSSMTDTMSVHNLQECCEGLGLKSAPEIAFQDCFRLACSELLNFAKAGTTNPSTLYQTKTSTKTFQTLNKAFTITININ